MSDEDIEIVAKWDGPEGVFITVLLEIGWLNRNGENSLCVHDWKSHQRFAYYSEERSKVASENAAKRWKNKRKAGDANRIQTAYGAHKDCNAPSPLPSPSHKDNKTLGDDALQLYNYYSENVIRVPAKKQDAIKNITKRFREGYSYRQLGKSIANYADECDEKKIVKRYHANNFFGMKAYFEGYLPVEEGSNESDLDKHPAPAEDGVRSESVPV